MANLFTDGTLKIYGGWNVKSEHKFNKDELNYIKQAVVVESQYGNSVCLTLMGGNITYIPLDPKSEETTAVGQVLDPQALTLITLTKPGENDIIRVRV